MELGLYCDTCKISFDTVQRQPLILPSCGHTICKHCAVQNSFCKMCKTYQTIENVDSLKINQKLFGVVSQTQKTRSQRQPAHFTQSQKQLYSFQTPQNQLNSETENGESDNNNVGYSYYMKSPDKNVNSTATQSQNQNKDEPSMPLQRNMTQRLQSSSATSQMFSESESQEQPQQQQVYEQKSKQMCTLHFDKAVEYYCSSCMMTVCSKCIFHSHNGNGHQLSQLEEAVGTLLSQVEQFDKKVRDSIKQQSDTKQMLDNCQSEIELLKERQIQIIGAKFAELQQKLEDRKQIISKDILVKFDNALFKINDRTRELKDAMGEALKIQSYTQDVIQTIINRDKLQQETNMSIEIQILGKARSLAKFLDNNFTMIPQQSKKRHSLLLSSDTSNYSITEQTATTKFSSFVANPSNIQSSKPPIASGASMNSTPSGQFKTPQLQKHKSSESPDIIATAKQINLMPTPKKQSGYEGHQKSKSINLSKEDSSDQESQRASVGNVSNKFGSKFAKMRFSRSGSASNGQASVSQTQQELSPDNVNNTNNYKSPQLKSGIPLSIKLQNNNTISQQILKQIPKLSIPIIKHKEDAKFVVDETDDQSQNINQSKIVDHGIFCVGDSPFILMFDYKIQMWQSIEFDKKESDYQGTLKYTSICQISTKRADFIMTGGCNKANLEASSMCFRFAIKTIRNFREIAHLKQARYGHASVMSANHQILVLGGFNHKDDSQSQPNTLKTCEKYNVKDNEWVAIAPMNQERAYFSACKLKEEFIYVFGGFQNSETISSMEFYNTVFDKWALLSIIMPIKLAKYGLAKIDENQLMLVGGLHVDSQSQRTGNLPSYVCVNTVYKFDCSSLKWTKLAKINYRRTLYQTLPIKENGLIYAIGGTTDGIDEIYDTKKKKWNISQASYVSTINAFEGNKDAPLDLQTFAIFSDYQKQADIAADSGS